MVTLNLAERILETKYDDFSENLVLHAKKSLLNWLGVTIGAIHHETIDILLAVADELGSAEQATILGRQVKKDLLFAVLINGTASHIFDYDDTHLDTIHHPSGPVAPVVFALGETGRYTGRELLRAYILGCEAELRIGCAVYPSHYRLGYHITSSTGVFGAAVASGLLFGLDRDRLAMAMGVAGTQAFGLREMFGTMTKPFHPGKAAQNGLLAAMLARRGFTSSKQVLEAKRGFANVMAPSHDLSRVLDRWGEVYEFEKNSFKPYACGIVLHPAIDACIELGRLARPEEVAEIEIRVNPYVLELTGKEAPTTGLEGKFSIYHSGAIAFLDLDAAEEQYTDRKVQAPETIELRKKIRPVADESIPKDKAEAVLRTKDGREYRVRIDHATGSLHNPMSQEMLERKFAKLCRPVLSERQIRDVIHAVMNLEQLESVHDILNILEADG